MGFICTASLGLSSLVQSDCLFSQAVMGKLAESKTYEAGTTNLNAAWPVSSGPMETQMSIG